MAKRTKLNERALRLCEAMVADAERLGIAVESLACGTRVVDCGVEAPGSLEAGRQLAEICLAGLGTVQIIPATGYKSATGYLNLSPLYPGLGTEFVLVQTGETVAACMASQYAGWQITGEKFFAMGSGPMRAAACREDIFKSIGHCEKPDVCVGVLETSKIPPESVCIDVAEKCGIDPARLTLLVARTASPSGTVQIVARSVETALHKLHEIGFDLSQVRRGLGWAPLPPVAADDLTAIGWTNDAILYGGDVCLWVTADVNTIENIGPRVPSNASPDYGRPFAEIFKAYDGDFYRIDPMLFSPAKISFSDASQLDWNHRTGPDCDWPGEMSFGAIAPEILVQSFGKK